MDEALIFDNGKRFETPFDLQTAVDLYFMEADEKQEVYLVEGLCCALGIERSTVLAYEREASHTPYHEIIRDAKRKIQKVAVERGMVNKTNAAFAIFNLKNNFGYVDKVETEATVRIDSVQSSPLNELTVEQLEQIEKIIRRE